MAGDLICFFLMWGVVRKGKDENIYFCIIKYRLVE